MAFSSEVDSGSREENASNQEPGASVLIRSEPIMLQQFFFLYIARSRGEEQTLPVPPRAAQRRQADARGIKTAVDGEDLPGDVA